MFVVPNLLHQMKIRLYHFILVTCFVLSGAASAQDSLYVTQVQKQMSLGMQNGFSVDIPQARVKDVVNSWKKYIRRGETKASVDSNDDEYQIRGTIITNISAQPMNVYAQVKEVEKGANITAYFTEDDTNYVSTASNAEKTIAAEHLMKDFARMQYRLAVENEVNENTRNLEKLETEKENLENEVERSRNNIKEYERKIARAKTDIESNGSEQAKVRAAAANQKEVVRATTPKTETYELEEKKLSSLEKELKKLEKGGEGLHSDIDGWNSDIRLQERNIEKNEDWIKEKKESISKQKDKVKAVKEKMENIR
jgi:predicted  nucleic acid-binding Zn-ribbon protein